VLPVGYGVSPQDAGKAAFDSDADPLTGRTPLVSLSPGEDNDKLDAGIYLPKASLGDFVWEDLDNDGEQDAGEPGLAGIRVILFDQANQPVDTTFTNMMGAYLFADLMPGTYSVRFSRGLPGYIFSPQDNSGDEATDSDVDPTTGLSDPITLSPGEDYRNLDAGLYRAPASLGDRVWDDLNEDGIQDTNEPGVGGVKVVLYSSNGNRLDSTTTDPQGYYLFNNLTPGNYRVGFDLPPSFSFSPIDAASDDVDSDADPLTGLSPLVNLVAGENELDVDAGMYQPKAKIGDYVWEDDDKDGEQDGSEMGIGGVKVVLYDDNDVKIDSTTTDPQGFYLFEDVLAGDYYVIFSELPVGYEFTLPDATNDAHDSDADLEGKTDIISLSPGEDYRDLDAGLILPCAELSGKLWQDLNENGTQQANEPAGENIRVVLYTCQGDSLDQQFTDANGNYLFANLPAGDYYLVFKGLPSGFVFTSQDVGINEEVDSDADGNGLTACISLEPCEVEDEGPDGGINPERVTKCAATDFDLNQYGLLFTSGNFPGTDSRYAIVPGTGEFITYVDGSARLVGSFTNMSDPNLGFDVDVLFVNRKDYGQWSAQGGSVKGAQNGPFMTWDFFEIDSLYSRLIGTNNLAGEVLTISHMPVSRRYGPQLGDGANDRNGDYGMSGWWFFNSISGTYSGSGDFNVSLDNCSTHSTPPVAPRLGGLALLEGAYDASAGMMRTDLRAQGILPQTQPFSAAPWNYNGTERLTTSSPDSIVDWVLVELRDVNDPKIILSTQAGLLLRQGQIVQPDGYSLLDMPQGVSSAYLVIYNWNHLPVMSAQPIEQHGKVFYFDFTQGMGSIYHDQTIPNAPAVLDTSGQSLLYQGDATGDGQINSIDLGQVMQQYFQAGAASQDVNLDGVVNSLDVGRSMSNYFKRTHVPK